MSDGTIITFILYLIFLLGIGIYFYRKSVNVEDYLLGGRRMGAWVTALSAQASDMSGWLLMGLPGAIYLNGLSGSWIAIGLFIGTVLNWLIVSPRLRIYTEKTKAITLPCYFEARFKDPTGLLRIGSSVIILIFFTIYVSSGLYASGRLFESILEINYSTAVIIGGVIIVMYTFLGGFMAVCWTDLFQGSLMVIAIVFVPVYGFFHIGGMEAIRQKMIAAGASFTMIPSGDMPYLAIISLMAWGLGYFGQPHILCRFMSIQNLHKLKESKIIAISWVILSLTGAVVVGIIGYAMFDGLSGGTEEKVFIFMIQKLFNPWIGGVLLAAILSAIMSTIDSQLLVASSALTEDLYLRTFNKNASENQVVWISRLCVIIISVVSLVLALRPNDTILGVVAYAWGGFGAAFGPLVLFSLYSKKTTWLSALLGMMAGTVVLVAWKQLGWGKYMYEIVPGFVSNCITIIIVNRIHPRVNPEIIADFDRVMESMEEQ